LSVVVEVSFAAPVVESPITAQRTTNIVTNNTSKIAVLSKWFGMTTWAITLLLLEILKQVVRWWEQKLFTSCF